MVSPDQWKVKFVVFGIGVKLKRVLEETNRHSNATIKVVGDANGTIGYVPEWLSKAVAPALKK